MKVSIIIPSYNGKQLLKANLPSVLKSCNYWGKGKKNWEIIVVDDASLDDTSDFVKKNYPQINIIRNHKNIRFARAVNRGVARAKGDIIILLNNDVKPKTNFLKPLVEHFKDKRVFAAGCLEMNLENTRKVIGGRGVGKFSQGFLLHQRASDQSQPTTLWVAAGSGAFRKSIWNKLGGLDPLFRPAYEEDRDISYNAHKAGYKLVFEPKSQVEHFHETSNLKVFGKNNIQIMSYKNQLLFVWKNISSPRLLLSHALWLPYHLIFTTIKTRGRFFLGFIRALIQLPEAIISRYKAKQLWQFSDEKILAQQHQ